MNEPENRSEITNLMGHKKGIAVWDLIFWHRASKVTGNICGNLFWFLFVFILRQILAV